MNKIARYIYFFKNDFLFKFNQFFISIGFIHFLLVFNIPLLKVGIINGMPVL
jgi:hypothetical protein